MPEEKPVEKPSNWRFTQKFRAKVDGRWRVVYYIDAIPRVVLKIDGEHTYLWYKDPRVDIMSMRPMINVGEYNREIHETECLSNRPNDNQ